MHREVVDARHVDVDAPVALTSALVTPVFHPAVSATPALSVMSSKRIVPRFRYSLLGPRFDVK